MVPSQESLFLKKLPDELRNKIYRLALVAEGRIEIDVDFGEAPQEPGILATCRQIRDEALSIYYHENTFLIDALGLIDDSGTNGSWDRSYAQAWLHGLGEERRSMIKCGTTDILPHWDSVCERCSSALRERGQELFSLHKARFQLRFGFPFVGHAWTTLEQGHSRNSTQELRKGCDAQLPARASHDGRVGGRGRQTDYTRLCLKGAPVAAAVLQKSGSRRRSTGSDQRKPMGGTRVMELSENGANSWRCDSGSTSEITNANRALSNAEGGVAHASHNQLF